MRETVLHVLHARKKECTFCEFFLAAININCYVFRKKFLFLYQMHTYIVYLQVNNLHFSFRLKNLVLENQNDAVLGLVVRRVDNFIQQIKLAHS